MHIKRLYIDIIRKLYLHHLRKSYKGGPISVISNNCNGGVLCHNLGLQFLTPTINLWIPIDDYINYVLHLKDFKNATMTEVVEPDIQYPIGILHNHNFGDVKIYFQHYKNFEEAKNKWFERSKRIDFNNIFLVIEAGKNAVPPVDNIVLKQLDSLPYKKVIFTDTVHNGIKSEFPLDIYDDNYFFGKILAYKNDKKRYIDDFDYVSFFNTGEIKKH